MNCRILMWNLTCWGRKGKRSESHLINCRITFLTNSAVTFWKLKVGKWFHLLWCQILIMFHGNRRIQNIIQWNKVEFICCTTDAQPLISCTHFPRMNFKNSSNEDYISYYLPKWVVDWLTRFLCCICHVYLVWLLQSISSKKCPTRTVYYRLGC